MSELLTTYAEVNGHLPGPGVLVADEDNAEQVQIGVYRVVRGMLSGVFTPTTLASWTTPASTPATIREIAAMLIASQLYQNVFGRDSTDYSAYARNLYDRAIAMLKEIRAGTITLEEVTDDTGGTISDLQFFPNSPDVQPPKFTMAAEF